jgi:hypothetical protein
VGNFIPQHVRPSADAFKVRYSAKIGHLRRDGKHRWQLLPSEVGGRGPPVRPRRRELQAMSNSLQLTSD